MGFGYALGGAAKGYLQSEQNANDQARTSLAARQLGSENALKARGLDIEQQRAQDASAQNLMTQADKIIASHVKVIGETVKHATAAGASPEQINAAIAPLLEDVDKLSLQIGRDPKPIHDQVGALMALPGGEATPKAGSTLEGIKALIAAGKPLTPGQQRLYDDSKRATSMDAALLQGLLGGDAGDGTAPATPAAAPTAPTTLPGPAAAGTIPQVPAPLAGKGAMWSPSKQRFYLPDGSSYNQQGIPQT